MGPVRCANDCDGLGFEKMVEINGTHHRIPALPLAARPVDRAAARIKLVWHQTTRRMAFVHVRDRITVTSILICYESIKH